MTIRTALSPLRHKENQMSFIHGAGRPTGELGRSDS